MGDRGRVTSTLTNGDAESVQPAPHGGVLESEILDAAATLFGRWGITKTTVADVAAEAGCSRATVYRAFPGGKQELFETVGLLEVHAFFTELVGRAEAADDLEDALVAVIATSHTYLTGHRGFQYMVESEPGLLLPYLGFHRIDRLYATVRDYLSPAFERFLGDDAPWAVEWAARIALSYLFQPDDAFDLSDPDTVRRLVRTRVLPGLTASTMTACSA